MELGTRVQLPNSENNGDVSPLHPHPRHIGLHHRPVVAQCLQDEEFVGQGAGGLVAQGHFRGGGGVEDDDVGLGARVQGADLVFQRQALGVAARGPVEGLKGVQALALQLQHLVALVQRAQQRIGRAAADVGGNGRAHAVALQPRLVEQPAAEEEVGRRAEHGDGAGLAHHAKFPVIHVDAVAEQGLVAKKAVALVDGQIVGMAGIEIQRVGDLVVVLVDVGLQVAVGVLGKERAGHLQLRRCRGDGKARRDDIERAAPAMPLGHQRLAVVIGRLRGVAEGRGRVAVHHRLAAQHAHAARLRLAEIGAHGIGVAGAIGHRRRRAMGNQRVIEGGGDALAVGEIGEFLLGREGVVVEPVEELVGPGGNHLRLREMQVRVNEAGHQEMRPVVGHRRGRRGCCLDLGEGAHGGDEAVLDQETAIGVMHQRAVIIRPVRAAEKGDDAAAQQPGRGSSQDRNPHGLDVPPARAWTRQGAGCSGRQTLKF